MERLASRAGVVPLTSDATLIVLAGGRSERMGRDKATLPVAGVTLLEWIVRTLGPSFRETIVAGASAPSGARAAADLHAHAGPLAGIEAGLRTARADRAFVIACDMPRVSARLATLLLERSVGHDIALPRVADLDQTTCAAYARSVLPRITAFLDSGGRRVATLIASLDAVRLDEAELARAGIGRDELADLDTPADYDAFVASLRA